MKRVVAAAIYARISSDPAGTGLGVERQLEDCRTLAEARGWTVAEEYVDNDISAYSGTKRPRYEAMLDDIADGLRDAVIVYNIDRLTRQPRQLEDFVALCDRVQMQTVATVTGDIDLGNDDGLFMARIMGAVAAKESARKSARLQRAFEQHAQKGLPRASGLRAYGWERDGKTLIPAEATVIRALVDRYLAGESVNALAHWLNEAGHRTTTGREWLGGTLRNMLVNPRLAGLRVHRGEVVGPGQWDAIISEDEHRRILAVVDSRVVTRTRTPRVALLTGIAKCGRCGGALYSGRKNGNRVYVCGRKPGIPNCGRLAINAEAADAIIAEAVLTRLDSPEFAAAMRGEGAGSESATELASAIAGDEARMDELATMFANGEISRAEWRKARDVIEARLKSTQRILYASAGRPAVATLAGTGSELRAAWSEMTLSRQAGIVKSVIETVTILPARHQGSRDYLSRLVPNWRL